MKILFISAMVIIVLMIVNVSANSQPQPSMYTMDNIYYYMAEGAEVTWGAHSLDPQYGVPGQDILGFTKSFEDIYYYMLNSFSQCNLTPDKVEEGYYFFCTDTNYWGVQEGTAPQETWYEIYGPCGSGTGDVALIGTMYVAISNTGLGCASGSTKTTSEANSWASGLDWLGQTDWRIPSHTELLTICQNKCKLEYYGDWYWSSTIWDDPPGTNATYNFSDCVFADHSWGTRHYVRAVRNQ